MMKYYQQCSIYVLITSVVTLMAILTNQLLFYIVYCLWIVRIICLKHKRIMAVCFIFSIVMALIGLSHIHKKSHFSEGEITTVLRVPANTIVVNGDKVSWRGYNRNEEIQGEYTLKSLDEKEMWTNVVEDLSITVTGTLEMPPHATNIFQFDYARYLKEQRNSFWILKVSKYEIKSRDVNMWMLWRRHIRENISPFLMQYVDSLLFGIDSGDMREVFQKIGVVYLISMSGIHVQWVLVFLEKILWRIGVTRELTHIIIKILAFFIGQMGMSIGVMRTVLVKIFPRSWSRLTKLSIIALFLLCLNPYYIFHLGFQLSFGLSILSCMTMRREYLWLMSTPFLSATFFEIPLASLLITPVLFKLIKWLIFPIIWLVALIVFIPINVSPIVLVLEAVVRLFHESVLFLSLLRIGQMVTGRLPYWRYLVISVFIIVAMLFVKKRRYFIMTLLGIFLLYTPISKNRIIMIDVGQGSSMLIQKNNHAVLVDTGGDIIFKQKALWKERERKSLAKRTLVPVLKSLGISQLSSVILTHADQDHVGALEDLKKEIAIKEIVYAKGAHIIGNREILAPEVLKYGDLQLDVLWPIKKGTGENDDSLVIYTTFGDMKWLMMGDASTKVEEKLMLQYPEIETDVLVVGHHGSRTSSSKKFIEDISPSYSLISVGKNNRFNHPDSVVLDNLKNTKVYRTDEHGGVTFEKIDGKWQFNITKD